MFYVLITIITACAFLLQVSVLPLLEIQSVFPNIVVVLSVFWLIHIRLQFSIIFVIVIGFLLDIFSQGFFGSHVLALMMTLGILKLIIDTYFQKENLSSTLFLQVLGTLFFLVLFAILNIIAARFFRVSEFTLDLGHFVAFQIPLSALYAGILTLVLFKPLKRLSDVIQYFQHRANA